MAYADQKMSGGKIVAIVIVALIHVALGYAFITGLAYQYIKKQAEKLNTFDVEEPPPPPPPDEPPPPPQDVPLQPPPVVSPPPIVPPVTPPPVVLQTVPTPPPVQVLTPIAAPPAPPAPPAVRVVSQRAALRGNVGQFFGPDSYPAAAQRDGAQGRVSATLQVGADGRVSGCTVTSSSGNSSLDDATCRISKARVRFTPAKDDAGQPMASTFPLNVTWRLPEE